MSHQDIIAIRSEIRGLSSRVSNLEEDVRRLKAHAAPAPLTTQAPPTTPHDEPPAADNTPTLEALKARKHSAKSKAITPTAPSDTTPPITPPTTTPTAPIAEPTPPPARDIATTPPTDDTDRINKTLDHAEKRDAMSLEWLVGGRIYAILGAIVVIAGIGLFLKLAWDQGWFEILPDAWKCILAAAFGALLLATGEVLRKKWGAIASIGCSAAGLGAIYASAYAAYAAFQLVPHQVGFAMLAATTVLGVLIGARARLVSIAIVSMLGAYLTPLFFLDVEPTPLVMPTYLSALLLTGLILCARLGGRFIATRTIAWWGTVLFGTVWTLASAADHPLIACAFLAFSWCAMQGELIYAALRASTTPDTLATDAPISRTTWAHIRPFMVSFSTSAWAGFMGGVVMHWWLNESWMAPAAGFAATTALGLWLAGHMRVLRDPPESDRERLGATFIAQAAVFLIMTIALGLAGWLEVAAWIAMGSAAIVAGRWMRARPLDLYGIATLAIASVRLVLFDKVLTPALAPGTDLLGLFLTRWSAMMALAAIAWIVTGELIRRTSHRRSAWFGLSIAMQIVGVIMLAALPFDNQTKPVAVAWLWLIMSAAAYTLGLIINRLEWRTVGATGVAVSLLIGLTAYEVWEWTHITAPPLAHAAWWFTVTGAAAWIAMGRDMFRREPTPEIRTTGLAFAIAGGCALFAASSLEVARVVPQLTDTQTAQRAAVSIWWGLCAVGLLAAGFLHRIAPARYLGLALLGLATLKAVVFDLIDVSAGWRVASFVLLGVLMIAVAAVYARVAHIFDQSTEDIAADSITDPDAIVGE